MTIQDELSSNLPIHKESLELETYLFGLRGQIEKLEAKKKLSEKDAVKADEIRAELEQLEIDVLSKKQEIENLKASQEVFKLSIEDLNKMAGDIKSSIDVGRSELIRLDGEMDTKNEQVGALAKLVQSAERQLISVRTELEEKINKSHEHDARLAARIAEANKILSDKRDEIDRAKEALNKLSEDHEKKCAEMEKKDRLFLEESKLLELNVEQLSQNQKKLRDSCDAIIAETEAKAAESRTELEKINSEKSIAEANKKDAEKDLAAAQSKLKTVQSQHEDARQFIENQSNTVSVIKRNALIEIARIAKQNNVKIDRKFVDGLIVDGEQDIIS